jgi:hypothetical protein
MPFNRCLSRLQFVCSLTLLAPFAATADVTVEEQLSLTTSALKAQGSSKQSTAADRQRTDVELRCEAALPAACAANQHTDITRLDRDAAWTMEPAKRAYTETLFKTPEQRRTTAQRLQAADQNSCPAQPADIDITQCELSNPKWSVDKTDDKATIAGYEGQLTKIRLTQSCTSSDPKQACELVYSYDAWLSRGDVPVLDERRSFQRRYLARLGLADSSPSVSAQFAPYLTRYANAMTQLSQKAGELAGYPLKSTFRVTFAGTPCGKDQAGGGVLPSALSGAGKAAAQSTSSSAEHAAGWGTADAVEHYTGSGVGSYVAGNAAGSFAGSLIGGLLAKKPKPQQARPTPTPNSPAATTLAEFTVETASVSAEIVPGSQFDVPPGWTKIVAGTRGDHALPSCPSATPANSR